MGELELSHGGQVVPLTVEALKSQVNLIQHVMKEVMHEGDHYGVVPGTEKPTLLKAGAEKLCMVFHLRALYPSVERIDLPNGHREQIVTCSLVSPAGEVIANGLGSCSTMESKYRYRNVADYDVLDDEIPVDSKERKAEYRKQGFGMKKVEGIWRWVKYKDAQRQENPDIADVYNTVLKMAAKRALTAATLNATAASDIFTQDMEEADPGVEPVRAEPAKASEVSEDRKALIARLAALGEYLTTDEKTTIRAETGKMTTEALGRYVQGWEARVHKAPKGAGVPDGEIPFGEEKK